MMRRSLVTRSLVVVVVIGSVICHGATAFAQEEAPPPAPPATTASGSDPYAEDLFEAGTKLLEEKRFDEALVKLEAAQKMEPGLGTQFNIAVCHEELGRLATALRIFNEVLEGARAAGKTQREHAARARVERLTARVPTIELRPANPDDVKDLIVKADGVILDPSLWSSWHVDPGDHVIEAAAPTKKSWTTTIPAPAEGEHATLIIPTLERLVLDVKSIDVPAPDTKATRRTLGYVFGGVGLAGVVASTVTGIMFLSARSIVRDRCRGGPNGNQCIDDQGRLDSRAVDARDRGETLAPINAVAWGVSAVGLGLGTFFILTSSHSKANTAKNTGFIISPIASPTTGGLSMRGDLPL